MERFLVIALLSLTLGCCARAEPSEPAKPDAKLSARVADDGTPEILLDGSPILTAGLHFWRGGWAYAWNETGLTPRRDGELGMLGRVPDMALALRARIDDRDPRRLVWRFTLDAERDLAALIGGGLEFNPALDRVPGAAPPELLEGNRGWRWTLSPGREVRVEFDPPLAELYFDRGSRANIRCMFLGHELAAGEHEVTMRVSLPEGAAVERPLAERYAAPDPATWHAGTLAWDRSPIDLSDLNDKPAGSRGFVRADGDRLVFADGTEARFWGTNLQAYALFYADRADAERQAKRLAALGYNLVRIHHHDSPWVDPNIFGGRDAQDGVIDPASADKLDWWVAKLEEQGIYVWLDLHVGRAFGAGEAAAGADEIARADGQIKGFNYVNPEIEARMNAFADAYLTRVNPYTGRRPVDDPGVAAVLVTNENDLTTHFGNLMLPDKGNGEHHRLFRERVRDLARAMHLDRDAAMRTWEPGPSKLVMSEIERAFFDRSVAHLRELGVRVPIATTSWWGNMAWDGLAALTRGDLIDVHSYGEEGALQADPSRAPNWIDTIALGQVEGKPLTVSEWNVPYPTRDRFTAPLWVSAMGSLQGWDALMQYGYLQDPLREPGHAGEWSAWVDPAMTALSPAAAVMFRERHLDPDTPRVLATPTRERVYFEDSTPAALGDFAPAAETGRFEVRLPDTPELEWDTPARSDAPFVPASDRANAGAGGVVGTPDGSLTRDWKRGVLRIDTARTQAASGWIGGETIALADTEFAIDTPAATVAVTALDARPIAESGRLLVTLVAQAAAPGDRLPFLAEPVTGRVRVRVAGPGYEARPVSPAGVVGDPVAASGDDGWLTLELDGSIRTHWFQLTPAP